MTVIEYNSSYIKWGDTSELNNSDRMRNNIPEEEHTKTTQQNFPSLYEKMGQKIRKEHQENPNNGTSQ